MMTDQCDYIYDKMSGFIDEGRVLYVIYLEFSKAFNILTQYYCILVAHMMRNQMG